MAKDKQEARGRGAVVGWVVAIGLMGVGVVVYEGIAVGREKWIKVMRVLKGDEPKIKPVVVDQEDLKRQLESRLRVEMEEKLSDQVAELRREMEEAMKREKAKQDVKEQVEPALGAVSDVRKLRTGIPFKTEVKVDKGGLASHERLDAGSYCASFQLSLKMPEPAKSLGDLEKNAAELSKILPGLPAMMGKAEVSPWYFEIYNNKVARIRKDSHLLNEVLSKHNLYDLETILKLTGEKGRKVFLMQSEMDVVSDGSDGDRLATMPEEIVNSAYYQPFTSYGWAKKSELANPMVAGWEKRLAAAQKEFGDRSTTVERKEWLKERMVYLKKGIADMKTRSFLIAEYDPFIVIPINILTARDAYSPKVGDYCVVIFQGKLYPAIVGDGGPTFKVGEGSLRLAKQLSEKATSNNRPVSDLKVSYLVFPGTAEEVKGPPDYAVWKQRCEQYLGEIGGIGSGYALHEWQDLLAKPPVNPEEGLTNPSTNPVPPATSGESVPPAAPAPPDAPKTNK